jgi:hypothetical protein
MTLSTEMLGPTPAAPAAVDPAARWRDALDYRAPYLEKKLLERRLVESVDEANLLFDEVKRFLVLQEANRGRSVPMYSERLDEIWHQFVLFTGDYEAYCQRFFGRQLAHLPENAPAMGGISGAAELSFDDFRAAYAELFGTPLTDLWNDELSLHLHRRVIRARHLGALFARLESDKAELCTEVEHGAHVLLRVDSWGEAALRFVSEAPTFYVRELPGIEDEDRVALARGLFRANVIRVAP